MKKILVTILLFTYAFAVTGASVDLHYCMGRFIGMDFKLTSEKDCSNCGMPVKDKKGCCNNKQIQVKVDKDQQATQNNISLTKDQITIVSTHTVIGEVLLNFQTIEHPSVHGPPFVKHTATYLLNCNFRI